MVLVRRIKLLWSNKEEEEGEGGGKKKKKEIFSGLNSESSLP